MDENTGSGEISGREFGILLEALQEEEQEFRAAMSEIDNAVQAQMANLQKDLSE